MALRPFFAVGMLRWWREQNVYKPAVYCVFEGIIGKMANSGSIVIKGTGGTNNLFRNIDKPYEFRNAVNEQIARLK